MEERDAASSAGKAQETQELITQGSKTRWQGSKRQGSRLNKKARIRIHEQGHKGAPKKKFLTWGRFFF